jgi:hypothetical protein
VNSSCNPFRLFCFQTETLNRWSAVAHLTRKNFQLLNPSRPCPNEFF